MILEIKYLQPSPFGHFLPEIRLEIILSKGHR